MAAKPDGILARPMAAITARHNEPWPAMARLSVEHLEVRNDDQVLDIGFGPGRTIELIAAAAPGGFVAGVDVSEAMVRLATRRNRAAVDDRRVELRVGSALHLPYPNGRFTKACACNTVQLWGGVAAGIGEVRRVRRPRGRMVISVRPRRGGRVGSSAADVEQLSQTVRSAGFHAVTVVSAPGAAGVAAVR